MREQLYIPKGMYTTIGNCQMKLSIEERELN